MTEPGKGKSTVGGPGVCPTPKGADSGVEIDISALASAIAEAILGADGELEVRVDPTKFDATRYCDADGNYLGTHFVCLVLDGTGDGTPSPSPQSAEFFVAAGGAVTAGGPPAGAEVCGSVVKAERCVKWWSTVVNLDNTKTRFNQAGEVRIHKDCGEVVTRPLPASPNWTAQVNAISALFAAEYPDARIDSRCNIPGGCGGLLEPPADAPTAVMFARYTSMVFCPTEACMPVRVEWRPTGGKWRDLILETLTTPERRGFECGPVCGPKTLFSGFDADGEPIPVAAADLPACVFDCAETVAAPSGPVCSFQRDDGCDENGDDITRITTVCPGAPAVVEWFVADADGALVEAPAPAVFVDCETGDPIPDPPVKAIEDALGYCGSPSVESTRHFMLLNFSPPTALPAGSTVTWNGQTVQAGGIVFDEDDNAIPGSTSWIGWLNGQFPDAGFEFVPGSGQDATWSCGPWKIDAPGIGTIVATDAAPVLGDAAAACTIPGDQHCVLKVEECHSAEILAVLEEIRDRSGQDFELGHCVEWTPDGGATVKAYTTALFDSATGSITVGYVLPDMTAVVPPAGVTIRPCNDTDIATECRVTVGFQTIADGVTTVLPAGGSYEIIATADGVTVDGAVLPCGTWQFPRNGCCCVLAEDLKFENNTGAPIVVIAEACEEVTTAGGGGKRLGDDRKELRDRISGGEFADTTNEPEG